VKAVRQLELRVTERSTRHRFSALLVWRERDEVTLVPRWLRAYDSYL
jgi:hypothetical protein